MLILRAVPSGKVLNLRTTAEQKFGAVPWRARRLLYHSTLGSRKIKKKKVEDVGIRPG